jgi:hypothetical protein
LSTDATNNWFVLAIKAFCAAIVFFAAAITIYTVGPAIETRLFPVVSKLRILSIAPEGADQSRILAEFTKLRSCEYIGLAWFHRIAPGGFERVPVILLRRPGDDSSPNRPEGLQRAGPWIVGIPPQEIASSSFAQLSHRCHPFWVTTTEFWP